MKAKKKIDYTDVLLDGIVVDSALHFSDDDSLADMCSRLVNGSGKSYEDLAELTELSTTTLRRIANQNPTELGEAYDPRSSTVGKLQKGLDLYLISMQKEKKMKKAKLTAIKGGKKK